MTSILRQTGSQLGTPISYTVTTKQTAVKDLEVEKAIKAEVWKRQIRMKYFFEDFDKLRKGFCTEDKVTLSSLSSAQDSPSHCTS